MRLVCAEAVPRRDDLHRVAVLSRGPVAGGALWAQEVRAQVVPRAVWRGRGSGALSQTLSRRRELLHRPPACDRIRSQLGRRPALLVNALRGSSRWMCRVCALAVYRSWA